MLCECNSLSTKLQKERYDQLSDAEIGLLRTTFLNLPRIRRCAEPRAEAPKRRRLNLEPLYPSSFRGREEQQSTAWRCSPAEFFSLCKQDYAECQQIRELEQDSDESVRLYSLLERVQESRDQSLLVGRIAAMALAQLAPKPKQVSELAARICRRNRRSVLDAKVVEKNLKHHLATGRWWVNIVQRFALEAQCRFRPARYTTDDLEGVLFLLGPEDSWIKETREDRIARKVTALVTDTNLCEQSRKHAPTVRTLVQYLTSGINFLPDVDYNQPVPVQTIPRGLASVNQSRPTGLLTTSPRSDLRKVAQNKTAIHFSQQRPIATSARRPLADETRCIQEGMPRWSELSSALRPLDLIHQTVPDLEGRLSHEQASMLILLCLFSNDVDVVVDLLWRGTTPRRRWDVEGNVMQVDPDVNGVDLGLVAAFSDQSLLQGHLHALVQLDIIQDKQGPQGNGRSLEPAIESSVARGLVGEHRTFWLDQALRMAMHAFPRRYLEPCFEQTARFHLPPFRHVFNAFHDAGGVEQLSPALKAELALCLIESSFYAAQFWKIQAMHFASELLPPQPTQQWRDLLAHAHIMAREIVMRRRKVQGRDCTLGMSAHAPLTNDKLQSLKQPLIHAARGEIVLQCAIDQFIGEEFHQARQILKGWQPLGTTQPSFAERIIAFQMGLWEGKAHYWQGQFAEALPLFQRLRGETAPDVIDVVDQLEVITYTADCLSALHQYDEARRCLVPVIEKEEKEDRKGSRGWCQLQLSLAETLWDETCLMNVEAICSSVRPEFPLSKFDHLRLLCLQGRIQYMREDWLNALVSWIAMLDRLRAFNFSQGYTTGICLHVLEDIVPHIGDHPQAELAREQIQLSRAHTAQGCRYWVPGLTEWFNDHWTKKARL